MSARGFTILMLVLLPVVALAAVSAAASPDPQVASLKKQLRISQAKVSDQQDEIDAQDQLIVDLTAQNTRLKNRDPLDAVLNRGPDGLWSAMVAIWQQMPQLDPGALCGYDRSNVPGGTGDGLTLTSYTFYRWDGC